MSRVMATALAAVLLVASVRPAAAAMATFDAAAVQKAATQIKELGKQLKELRLQNEQMQKTLNAIGDAGKITLPMVNMKKLRRQLDRDLQCLIPDWQVIMPSVEWQDIELPSLCDRTRFYKETLLANPDANRDRDRDRDRAHHDYRTSDSGLSEEFVRVLKDRRKAFLADALTKSLAHADQSEETVGTLTESTADLESTAAGAQSQNERLAVIAQGQVLEIRALTTLTQIMAQMQRMQAAFFLQAGIEPTYEAKTADDAGPDAEN